MHIWSMRRMKDRYTVAAACDLDRGKAEAVAERTGADIASFEEVVARDGLPPPDDERRMGCCGTLGTDLP